MLAFKIEIDGKRWLIAGVQDWNMLLLQIGAHQFDSGLEMDMRMSGTLGADENGVTSIEWPTSPQLSVGSEITITLVETDCADKPTKSERLHSRRSGSS